MGEPSSDQIDCAGDECVASFTVRPAPADWVMWPDDGAGCGDVWTCPRCSKWWMNEITCDRPAVAEQRVTECSSCGETCDVPASAPAETPVMCEECEAFLGAGRA